MLKNPNAAELYKLCEEDIKVTVIMMLIQIWRSVARTTTRIKKWGCRIKIEILDLKNKIHGGV